MTGTPMPDADRAAVEAYWRGAHADADAREAAEPDGLDRYPRPLGGRNVKRDPLDDTRDAVDAAVLAHRADPTPATRAALDAAATAHVDAFYRAQAAEYVERVTR